jgi:CspA family cold shock protein
MATGAVKTSDPDRGFGFIKPDEGWNDVFVQISAGERSGIQLHQGHAARI